jgi:PAS domain S-box-containing protein
MSEQEEKGKDSAMRPRSPGGGLVVIAQPSEGRAIFTADARGYVETFPPEASNLFGWTPEEVVGKKRVSLFHKPEALKELLPQMMKLATERGVIREETTMIRKDRSEFQADLRVTPVYKGEEFVGYRTEVRGVES